jgi:hypothetical protein
MHTTAQKIECGGKKPEMTSETSGDKQQGKCPLYVNYSIKMPVTLVSVYVGCRSYCFIVNMCCQFH